MSYIKLDQVHLPLEKCIPEITSTLASDMHWLAVTTGKLLKTLVSAQV